MKFNVFVSVCVRVHVCIECVSDVLKVSFKRFSCVLFLGVKIFGLRFIELSRQIRSIK